MKTRLLFTTAVGLVFATAALAQAPRDSTSSPTPQTQTPSTAQKSPEPSSGQAPSSSAKAPAPPSGASQAQTTPSTSSQPSGTSAPAQAQTSSPAPSSNQAQQTPATGSSGNQAQQAPSTSSTTAQQPSQNTTAQQPSSNTTAQQPSNTNTAQQPSQNTTAQQPSNTNTAQQPAQTNPPSNTAQSPSTNVNAQVNLNDQQRTRVTESISRLNVQPLTNVNFSLAVGTAVPRDVRLQTLPAEVVNIVPQYRGYSFFMVRDEIVIVEPSTYKIVTVLPRSGGSAAAAPAQTRSKMSFTDKDRDVVRKHVRARPERPASGSRAETTGSSSRTVIRRGERVPDSVEVEEFPETVYRDAPELRNYRYIHRENRTYIVDPAERTVIDDFD